MSVVSRPTSTRTLVRALLAAFAVALLAAFIAAIAVVVLAGAIWPGVLEYTAPLACPPGFPDGFVQEHVFSIPGETRRSWSLLCMSEHGALHRPSLSIPWLALIGIAWLPVFTAGLLGILAIRRHHPAPPRAA